MPLPVTWHDFLNLTIQIFIMDNVINNAMSKGSKKEFRKTISAKLESSLVEFQNDLKEKKFKAAVKRASKLLANDLFVKQKKKKEKRQYCNGGIYWSIIFLLISLPFRLRRDGFIIVFFYSPEYLTRYLSPAKQKKRSVLVYLQDLFEN